MTCPALTWDFTFMTHSFCRWGHTPVNRNNGIDDRWKVRPEADRFTDQARRAGISNYWFNLSQAIATVVAAEGKGTE